MILSSSSLYFCSLCSTGRIYFSVTMLRQLHCLYHFVFVREYRIHYLTTLKQDCHQVVLSLPVLFFTLAMKIWKSILMIKYAWVMVFFILITRQLMHVLRKKAKFPNSFFSPNYFLLFCIRFSNSCVNYKNFLHLSKAFHREVFLQESLLNKLKFIIKYKFYMGTIRILLQFQIQKSFYQRISPEFFKI